MIKKTLSNNFSLPNIGLGTWLFGGGINPDYTDDEKIVEVIKASINMGYTHIDTAAMYGLGL